MTLREYLIRNKMTLSEFSKKYELNYHRLFRVKQGGKTRDKKVLSVLEMLGITQEREVVAIPMSSFMTQECICINQEKAGDIYCHYRHQLDELEAYLSMHQIPYYVRQGDGCWIVKYDKEAEMNKGEF